jgi:hypothetical protein
MKNLDFEKEIEKKLYEEYKPSVMEHLKKYTIKSKSWNRCYIIKQLITDDVGYFFQKDMYHYLKEYGYETKIDKDGDHFARVERRKLRGAKW